MQRVQVSEALCRKGGTSRSDNAPHASGACAGAKLACGATLSATREFGSACAVAQTSQPPHKRHFNPQNATCGQVAAIFSAVRAPTLNY